MKSRTIMAMRATRITAIRRRFCAAAPPPIRPITNISRLRAATRPRRTGMHLYRTLDWGRLAQFQILDDRQYRGLPACQPPGLVEAHQHYRSLIDACAPLGDPNRTMLGAAQERWLMDQLGRARAVERARAADADAPAGADRFWPSRARRTIFRRYAGQAIPPRATASSAAGARSAPAIRSRWAAISTPSPPPISAIRIGRTAPPIATEFVGGSITSLLRDPSFRGLADRNGLGFAEDRKRGYGRLSLTPTGGEMVFRGLDDSRRQDSGIADIARFDLPPNRPGLNLRR